MKKKDTTNLDCILFCNLAYNIPSVRQVQYSEEHMGIKHHISENLKLQTGETWN